MFRLRAQQIIIDLPRVNSEPWVNVIVQRVELDEEGRDDNVVDRWGSLNKRLSEFALDTYAYFEAIPVESGRISGYAMSDAVAQAVIQWMAEKYNGTIIDGNVLVS